MARAFRVVRGGVQAQLDDAEAELLDALVRQVRDLLGGDLLGGDLLGGDDALARLLPDGYRDDPEAAAELRSLTQDDLVAGKRAALDAILESMSGRDGRGRVVLGEPESMAWLTGLNDVRLTLGTRLGVTEDTHAEDTDAEDTAPEAADVEDQLMGDVYDWLGWLQDSLVVALSADLDQPGGPPLIP